MQRLFGSISRQHALFRVLEWRVCCGVVVLVVKDVFHNAAL